jgi:hypothetical protein
MGWAAYIGLMTLFVLLGLFCAWLASFMTIGWTYQNPWQYVLTTGILLLVALMGMWITDTADGLGTSQLGSICMSVPFGLMLGSALSHFTGRDAGELLVASAVVVLTFGVFVMCMSEKHRFDPTMLAYMWVAGLATMYLVAVISWMLSGLVIYGDWIIVEHAIVWIVSGWMAYVMHRGMDLDRTERNASDVAASIHMDVLNVFLAALDSMWSVLRPKHHDGKPARDVRDTGKYGSGNGLSDTGDIEDDSR